MKTKNPFVVEDTPTFKTTWCINHGYRGRELTYQAARCGQPRYEESACDRDARPNQSLPGDKEKANDPKYRAPFFDETQPPRADNGAPVQQGPLDPVAVPTTRRNMTPDEERDRLAEAIAEQAKRVGIYNGEGALDGPTLLLLLQDMGDVLVDRHRLTRELDEALSGPGNAAKQASLCDLIPQAKAMRTALRFYMAICGNTGHSISRESAQEAYAMAKKAGA